MSNARTYGTIHSEQKPFVNQHANSTDYLLGGSLVMTNGKINKNLFEGGYAQATSTSMTTDSFAFNYYNQDHLGNNRMVMHEYYGAEQMNNYYPYGGLMSNSTGWNVQRYKYNGKEFDRMHGLDWYDYGARWMDASIGRWHSMDPLSEKYYNVSPYNYCHNNPVMRIDPDGRTDYYTMSGSLHKTVNDGCTDKRLILASGRKKSLDKAIESNQTVIVPSNEIVDKMKQCYSKTEKSGKETGFVIGTQGTVSQIVEGTETKIKEEWKAAFSDLKAGEYGAWDVHVHPLGNYKETGKYGLATPSQDDIDNVIGIDVGNQPSAVLGYEQNPFSYNPNRIGGNQEPTFSQKIAFYNQNGVIGESMLFTQFCKAVKKINGK